MLTNDLSLLQCLFHLIWFSREYVFVSVGLFVQRTTDEQRDPISAATQHTQQVRWPSYP